jgi:hypothetical protein
VFILYLYEQKKIKAKNKEEGVTTKIYQFLIYTLVVYFIQFSQLNIRTVTYTYFIIHITYTTSEWLIFITLLLYV